jgi:hypothetical protein
MQADTSEQDCMAFTGETQRETTISYVVWIGRESQLSYHFAALVQKQNVPLVRVRRRCITVMWLHFMPV